MTAVELAPLDPLSRCERGRYEDGCVVVDSGSFAGVRARLLPDGRVHVRHCLPVVDDDLAETLAAALSPLTSDHDVFARAFTGIVLTSQADPLAAWEAFYRASLARRGGYDEVYLHALDLLPHRRVLDLGCGFGLLSLRLAAAGTSVIAADIDAGTLALVRAVSGRLGAHVETVESTALLGDRTVDAVALVHVLEHLDPVAGATLLAEALRLAAHTVVVAVPYETTPNPLYGHVRCVRADDLAALGRSTGWAYEVHTHHGGWLVLSQP